MKLEIRTDLHIDIYTVPGSAHIQWWLGDFPRIIFNPTDGSIRPRDPDSKIEGILSCISPSDLTQITKRLLQHAVQRRKHFAGDHLTILNPHLS